MIHKAKIVSKRMLVLEKPIEIETGKTVDIIILDGEHDKTKQHFLNMYSKEDSIYDEENEVIASGRIETEKDGLGSEEVRFGSARGKVTMAENFDASLEDFEEYME